MYLKEDKIEKKTHSRLNDECDHSRDIYLAMAIATFSQTTFDTVQKTIIAWP